jgi:hypothetical protein
MRAAALLLLSLLSCRNELPPPPSRVVDPPVSSPEGIPDAPVSGRVHGAPFAMREARYIVDRRVGYAHTDILLSSGTVESPCGPLSPSTATSVWLRLEGGGPIRSSTLRVGPGGEATWQVHYQVFDGAAWSGAGGGTALLTLHEPGPDGRVSGGLAACFPDDAKSCISGSFDAVACPPTIDQPVRGTPPPEAIPQAYLHRTLDAGR